MNLHLQMNCDNAAFEDEPASEIARILRKVATDIENGRLEPIALKDANGNSVGFCQIQTE